MGLLGPAGIGKGCRPAAWTLGREAGIAYLHVVHLGRRLGWWIFMLDAAATGSVGRNGQHLAMGERSADEVSAVSCAPRLGRGPG